MDALQLGYRNAADGFRHDRQRGRSTRKQRTIARVNTRQHQSTCRCASIPTGHPLGQHDARKTMKKLLAILLMTSVVAQFARAEDKPPIELTKKSSFSSDNA